MFRTTKRLLIPIIAAASALVIILCSLFSINYDPSENELITVYCVTQKIESNNNGKIIHYSYDYDEKGRFIEIRKDDGKTVKKYSYDENGNTTLYPNPGGGHIAATYDKNGNILTYKCYGSDINNPYTHEEYIYDTNFRRIITVSYNRNGVPHTKKEHTYDEHGNLVKTLIYQGDELKGILNYVYVDAVETLISYQEYTVNNSSLSLKRYIDYDENGNQVSYVEYNDGKLHHYIACRYDELNRMTVYESMIESEIDGLTETRKEYVYNSAGQLIQAEIFTDYNYVSTDNPNGIVKHTIDYEYDNFGNVVKETITADNDKPYIRQWSYDHKGNLISYGHSAALTKWYYDSHGNIIKEEYIVNGNVRNTTEYTYTSFKVTRKEAKFIKAQQEEIFNLPVCDVTPKLATPIA